MSHFETFKKSDIPHTRQPRITIQKRGTITMNVAAYDALGEPDAVELLYDEEDHALGLRAVASDVPHASFVRPSSRSRRGPWVISAMAFVRHYGIDTRVARRWAAQLLDGMLRIRLDDANEDVSRPVHRSGQQEAALGRDQARSRRPRPQPGRSRAED